MWILAFVVLSNRHIYASVMHQGKKGGGVGFETSLAEWIHRTVRRQTVSASTMEQKLLEWQGIDCSRLTVNISSCLDLLLCRE